MTTREAIQLIARELKDELVVCTTGYTCRDMQAASDRPENFYMIGSMGLAASLGLGVALSQKKKTVVILDGDGSLLMGLGTLPMVGALRPQNFIHVVLDNEAFVSTGSQPTYSRFVPLERMALASGYAVVRRACSPEEVTGSFSSIRKEAGPAFLLVKCARDAGAPLARVHRAPQEITERFMEAMAR
jgi:thiamine pyrophosphate-dependent acetolactate synthase large subunit-like protein